MGQKQSLNDIPDVKVNELYPIFGFIMMIYSLYADWPECIGTALLYIYILF
jgi:hypothetical protein